MAESVTIARPYAEAVYRVAQESGAQEIWSARLQRLALISQDGEMASVIGNPLLSVEQVAELFISPLGLSFVSKVAPPHLQGLMQGCWLAATAVGNSLLFIGGILYTTVPIWACWLVFVGATGASMIVMLSMVKWLERVAK
jgi:dipeptide/tripeptide permease